MRFGSLEGAILLARVFESLGAIEDGLARDYTPLHWNEGHFRRRRGSTDGARSTRIGAPGWLTWPLIVDVVAVQRRVARAAGCAFYDQMEAIGGAGTMMMWAAEPRAARSGGPRSLYASRA
jgi:hypothetical protein